MMTFLMGLLFYCKNLALALDQLGNALIGGDPDETISRRAGRARVRNETWGCWLCRVLDWIDGRHCASSVVGDNTEEGMNSVPQMLSRWQRGEPATWFPPSSGLPVQLDKIIEQANQTADGGAKPAR